MIIDYKDNSNQPMNIGRIIGIFSVILVIVALPTIVSIVNTNRKQITTSNASQYQITLPVQTSYTISSPNDIVNEIGEKLIYGSDSSSNILGTGIVSDQSYLGLRFTGGVVRLNNPVVSAKIILTVSQPNVKPNGFTMFKNSTNTIMFSYGVVDSLFAAPFDNTNIPSKLFRVIKPVPPTLISPIDQQNATFSIDVTNAVAKLMQEPNRKVDMPVEFIFKGYGAAQNRVFIYNTQTPEKAPRLIVTYQFITDNTIKH